MAFDIMHLNGKDLRREPLIKRRECLQELVGQHDPGFRIQFSEHVLGGGVAMFEAADRMGLEGIVSKRINSRYRSGRSRSWLKVKCFAEGEFVVIGVQPGDRGPATALLAREADERLEYVGGAAITLADGQRDQFWRSVEALATAAPVIAVPKSGRTTWLRLGLSVRARHLKGSDRLRHATLCGLADAPVRS